MSDPYSFDQSGKVMLQLPRVHSTCSVSLISPSSPSLTSIPGQVSSIHRPAPSSRSTSSQHIMSMPSNLEPWHLTAGRPTLHLYSRHSGDGSSEHLDDKLATGTVNARGQFILLLDNLTLRSSVLSSRI